MKAQTTQTEWEDLVLREEPEAAPSVPQPALRPSAGPDLLEQKMASYMTHELRAPLTSIRSALGLLQMQLEGRLQPDERQILGLALKNSERLNGLITDILDFSKLQAGKMKMSLEAARAEDLIDEAIDTLRSWSVSKGVRLVRAEGEPLPRIYADPKRSVQVLVNLLSNAIKFTPAGGKVEVSAAPGRHEHAGTIVFRVKDTGPGIAKGDIERIFHCFEQSALGAKASNGTGLGLTLSRAMVELQGGRIWAESWKGLGASFFFTIPILRNDMARPVEVYPKPVEYHGLFVSVFRRMNSFVAALFA